MVQEKRKYRLGLPRSFLLHPVTIRRDKNTEIRDGVTSELSDVVCWCGYDILYTVEITTSNVIKGYVNVTFPAIHS